MTSNRRIEGAAAWAAYGALEVVFAVYARRLLFAPTFAPHHGTTLLLLVLYPLAGALLGRFAVPALAVLFAANAVWFLEGRMLTLAIGVAAIVLVLRPAIWTSAALLTIPLWMARELARHEPILIRVAAAAVAVIAISLIARIRKHHDPLLRPAATLGIFTLAMAGSFFVDVPPPRDEAAEAPPPRTAQQNVLLVLMDTVRADHLSAYGYARDTTPHLTRFAQTATLYRRAHAPSNMTLSSTASLFTGAFPSEHTAHFDEGVWMLGRPLPPSAVTLAELSSARGYATASIAANHIYLGSAFGLDQGFQHLDARPAALPFGAPADSSLRRGVDLFVQRVLPARFRIGSRRATEITDRAREYLARVAGKRRPFLLVVNYMDAHEPYIPPPPYDTRFPGRDASQNIDLADRLIATMMQDKPLRITARERAHLLSQYDGAIAYEDAEIARLIGELRTRGMYDDTLIVIVADHGEAFGEHGVVSHGATNYEHQVRVPMIIKLPGQKTGRVVEQPVSTLDAWPLMSGNARAPYPVITESFPMRGRTLAQKYRRPGRAIIDGTLKTIVNVQEPLEFYDLSRDPAETHNLGRTEVSARMSAELNAWQASLRAHKPLPPRELDAETIRRLRALGYMQ
ncbi:MAG: sulfatase-like hydrolase/transferase [Acidobacteriota bacterium]|nr:sulfatase-like hydrolase/transferase [Acidobacteriota bacterium]